MSFLLPSAPTPITFSPLYASNGTDLTGPLGGPTIRGMRLGDRFGFQIAIRPTKYNQGKRWQSALIKGTTDTAIIDVYQRGFQIGSPGAPAVNGAGQAGTLLVVDNLRPRYCVSEGQYFSFVHTNGRRYLHMITADGIADASGNLVISFLPMLRVSPADNTALEISRPRIEGWMQDMRPTWNVERDRLLALSFTLLEAE
jgi:hypothetical protein